MAREAGAENRVPPPVFRLPGRLGPLKRVCDALAEGAGRDLAVIFLPSTSQRHKDGRDCLLPHEKIFFYPAAPKADKIFIFFGS
jgi:hypothetical protein